MRADLMIGIIGNFDPSFRAHTATNEATAHTSASLGLGVEARWLETETLGPSDLSNLLAPCHGLWCAPSSPYKNLEGALASIRHARERGLPFTGT